VKAFILEKMPSDDEANQDPDCPKCGQPMTHIYRVRSWPQPDFDVFRCESCDVSKKRTVS
jgi:hypothetical protein